MNKYTFEEYRSLFNATVEKNKDAPFYAALSADFGAPQFPSAASSIAVVGIRHTGEHIVDDRENTADDIITLCKLGAGVGEVYEFVGTTESGLFTKVENAQGDFKLFPGFYFFKKGLHHSQNPCLVQAAPVRGQRAPKHQEFHGDYTISDGSLHIHAGI